MLMETLSNKRISTMITILDGNALDKLKEIDDNSIQCVVTSPPYWNLRNYNHLNQIGKEKKPEN